MHREPCLSFGRVAISKKWFETRERVDNALRDEYKYSTQERESKANERKVKETTADTADAADASSEQQVSEGDLEKSNEIEAKSAAQLENVTLSASPPREHLMQKDAQTRMGDHNRPPGPLDEPDDVMSTSWTVAVNHKGNFCGTVK